MPAVTIEQIPGSIEEFVELRNRIGETPEGGAAMMVLALLTYGRDQGLGRQFLTVAADRGRLKQGPGGYKGWELVPMEMSRLKDRILRQPHIPCSYIQGTGAAGGYALPDGPITLEISSNPHSGDQASGTFKVFVASTGADSARPITVKLNDKGYWKGHEWSSLTMGVVPPVQIVDDDL